MLTGDDRYSDQLMHNSHSAPSLTSVRNGPSETPSAAPPRPMPIMLVAFALMMQPDNRLDMPPPSSRSNSIPSSNNGNGSVTVRPRPRPSSGGRAASPADLSMRRSGYIECTDGDRLRLSSPTMDSRPKTPTELPAITTTQPVTRNHDTIWEDFLAQSCEPLAPAQTHNQSSSNPFDQPITNNGSTSVNSTGTSAANPFDMDFLQVSTVYSPGSHPGGMVIGISHLRRLEFQDEL